MIFRIPRHGRSSSSTGVSPAGVTSSRRGRSSKSNRAASGSPPPGLRCFTRQREGVLRIRWITFDGPDAERFLDGYGYARHSPSPANVRKRHSAGSKGAA
ncbi:MAG: hypothetical protein L6W00_25555 [Lentisphaeria bacterium]|nr:MAG: hypothetical protein L6W00_25555 [Lentisphaeria bacterium]